MKNYFVFSFTLVLVLSIGMVSLAAEEVKLLDPYVTDMPQGKYGGTLITAMLSDPNTFNPVLSGEQSSDEIFEGRTFDALAMINPESGRYEPTLARSWKTSEDGLTWTFHLRRGVQWSDGVEFTADDVIFTYDVTLDEDVASPGREGLFIDGEPIKYEKVDKYTVNFTTPKPFAPLLSTLLYIVPKHKLYDSWKAGKFNETWGIDTDPGEIVGTGPLTLAQYVPGQRIVYLRNSKYWKVSPDGKSLPYIDRWVAEIVPDTDARLLKFQNGETHLSAVDPQNYERIKAGEEAGNYTVHEAGTSFTSTLITFNMNPRNPDFKEHPWKNEWFRNIHFRRALNHATDRGAIAEQLYAGMAVPQWTPVNYANKFWINKDVRTYPFSLEKAKEELKKGGFSWNDAGQLIGPDRHPVEINILTTETSSSWVDLLNIIASDYQKLGIKVHANPVAFSNLIERLTNTYEWDMIIVGWGGGGTELYGGFTMWLSSAPYHLWNPELEEPEFEWEARINELWDLAATNLDIEKRKEYYNEWQQIYSEQLPLLYSVNIKTFSAVTNKLKNVRANSLGGDVYNGSVTWDITNLYFE